MHDCYKVDTYRRAYSYSLAPLRHMSHCEKMDGVVVYPPVFTKQMGRPKRSRRKAQEKRTRNGITALNKNGVRMHFSLCGLPDHNRKGHFKYSNSYHLLHMMKMLMILHISRFLKILIYVHIYLFKVNKNGGTFCISEHSSSHC